MPIIYLIFLWKQEKEVDMDQIRQNEYFSSTLSSKTTQSHQDSEDHEDNGSRDSLFQSLVRQVMHWFASCAASIT